MLNVGRENKCERDCLGNKRMGIVGNKSSKRQEGTGVVEGYRTVGMMKLQLYSRVK